MRLWIEDRWRSSPGAGRNVVAVGARIAERIGRGVTPERIDAIFDASRHVVLPGLINAHHHFYQTLTRAHPKAINKSRCSPGSSRSIPSGRGSNPIICGSRTRLALTELLLSGCTTAADHHYLYPEGLEDAVDIEVEEARGRLGMRMTTPRAG